MAPDQTISEPPFIAERSESLRRAFALARGAHAGESRKGDGSPYISHPVRVAEWLAAEGFDDAVLAAALLHDVAENTELTVGDILERFGTEIGELVAALTEDAEIDDYEQRKDAHRAQVEAAGERATAIYVADKLSNLRDMRALYAELGERAGERFTAPTLDARVLAWRRDVEMAARLDPELTLLAPLRRELEGFEADRAARREAEAR